MLIRDETIIGACAIVSVLLASAAFAFAPEPQIAPAHQQAIEEMRRDVAASKVCQGQPFYWQDAATLVCATEARP